MSPQAHDAQEEAPMSNEDQQIVLSPPQAIVAVEPTKAESMVTIDPSVATQLDEVAQQFADSLDTVAPTAPEFAKKGDSVRSMGDREIRESAEVSNRMLQRPIHAMDGGLLNEKSPVGKSLVDLRKTIDDLDPSKQSLFSPKKLLGLIPFGDHVRDYFLKYESAETHLAKILQALYNGQDELRQDNAAIEQERANLWDSMQKLKQYAYLAAKIDADVEAKAASVSDAERAKALREDVLFPVRQKRQDLLTQLAVSAQGYLALDLVRKNNVELIKGVDRATTTTVSALRTAVIVAQALANQKLVLDQITALNETTSDLIESTSEMLRDQTTKVNEQASSSTIEVDKLKAAFANVYASIDAIDGYRERALGSMQQTVQSLETEVQKAQAYLDRSHGATDDGAGGELALPDLR
jgi:uncharacterized protein YaaN involved in tellurite resistance